MKKIIIIDVNEDEWRLFKCVDHDDVCVQRGIDAKHMKLEDFIGCKEYAAPAMQWFKHDHIGVKVEDIPDPEIVTLEDRIRWKPCCADATVSVSVNQDIWHTYGCRNRCTKQVKVKNAHRDTLDCVRTKNHSGSCDVSPAFEKVEA